MVSRGGSPFVGRVVLYEISTDKTSLFSVEKRDSQGNLYREGDKVTRETHVKLTHPKPSGIGQRPFT